jgi:hypothetical protein
MQVGETNMTNGHLQIDKKFSPEQLSQIKAVAMQASGDRGDARRFRGNQQLLKMSRLTGFIKDPIPVSLPKKKDVY